MKKMSDAATFEPIIQRVLEAAAAPAHASTNATQFAPANMVGPNGSTPLVMVCSQGREAAVRALVTTAGVDINLEAWAFDDDTAGVHANQDDVGAWKKRRTPLMAATAKGHTDCARVLLALGASVNRGKSDSGATALYIGAQEGHLPVVRLLLQHGAAVNQSTEYADGSTPVHMAAGEGHFDVVKLLVQHGADLNQTATAQCSAIMSVFEGGGG
jgi:ankyrin repeat protein